MRKIPATLVAMFAGWALALTGYGLWGGANISGTHVTKTTELVGVAAATAACAVVAWLIVVLPLIWWWGDRKIFSDLRWSWLGWALMGTGSFLLLMVPLFGTEVLAGVWFPASMGAIAGVVFALLRRKSRAAAATAKTPTSSP
jgi:hypothetical protein